MEPRGQNRGADLVRVPTEEEAAGGWVFALERAVDAAFVGATRHEMSLSWPDYEHWAHGMRSPSAVAEAVARALLEIRPDLVWPEKFDASTARRWAPGLDARVRELL